MLRRFIFLLAAVTASAPSHARELNMDEFRETLPPRIRAHAEPLQQYWNPRSAAYVFDTDETYPIGPGGVEAVTLSRDLSLPRLILSLSDNRDMNWFSFGRRHNYAAAYVAQGTRLLLSTGIAVPDVLPTDVELICQGPAEAALRDMADLAVRLLPSEPPGPETPPILVHVAQDLFRFGPENVAGARIREKDSKGFTIVFSLTARGVANRNSVVRAVLNSRKTFVYGDTVLEARFDRPEPDHLVMTAAFTETFDEADLDRFVKSINVTP